MISLFGSVFPQHILRKNVAMQANSLIWQESEERGPAFWQSEADMKICRELVSKEWSEFTDKDVEIVEMMALKYADKPTAADLSKYRVLN